MSQRRLAPLLLLALLPAPAAAQTAPQLQAGPMVGYSEMREVMLWAQTRAPARVKAVYWDSLAPATRLETAEVRTEPATALTARLIADRVEPGRVYLYEIHVDGRAVRRPYHLRFQTQSLWHWRTDPPAFRFMLGSCFYVNEPAYDRPGRPYGGDFEILQAMTAKRPDAMLWLGDNLYLREADWYSRTGIMARYTHSRALPELQPFLGSVHHYAIWDDHDYGPNDSDRSFRDKAKTLEAFRLFWGNPSYGMDGVPGTVTTFEWADVQFFLLDDRWHRAPNDLRGADRDYLGQAQLDWLIDALASSRAPFKLVAVGGQVLNPLPRWENYANFPAERARLLSRIEQEGIRGVMFLTGDRHHTELTRLERRGTYPLYDLTVSPLTATPSTVASEPNYLRVEGTQVTERNFATLDVSGPRTDRQMTITVWDVAGREKWSRTIKASELR